MGKMTKSTMNIKSIAKEAISIEANALQQLVNHLDDDFEFSVKTILRSKGRVVISGIGKSAIIGQKMVSTFNSTGTPALFMHAADAIHGDLGMIRPDDVVICISNSGNTPEIRVLIPLIKDRGNVVIAMVGNLSSYLAQNADFIINTTVSQEACPNNLAPTSSTTAQLAMGDAIAVSLLKSRGFSTQDFARLHPGGIIGKKLYLKVSDLAVNNDVPQVNANESVMKTIIEISSKRLGATAVLEDGKLIGIITDGDLRRMLEKNQDINHTRAKDIMSANPKTVSKDMLVVDALNIMRKNNITQLLIVEDSAYLGVIHIHDILKEGIL
jgi:arabinose-5-phosphate isomerase